MRQLSSGIVGFLFAMVTTACSSGGGGGAASCADGGACPAGTACNPSTSLCEAAATGGGGGTGNVGGTGNAGGAGNVGNAGGAGNVGNAGGAGNAAGSSGAGGGTCVPSSCQTFLVGGAVTMAGCCPSGSFGCGAEVDANLGSALGIDPSCYPLNAPGPADTSCPEFAYTNPVTSSQDFFAPCCQANGKCGAFADVSGLSGPDFGCADVWGASAQNCGVSP